MASLAFSGSGSLSLAGGTYGITPESRLTILDTTLRQAPTSVVANLLDGIPGTDVTFSIDGTNVFVAPCDSDGNLFAVSVPVPESVGAAGSHTLTAEQPGALTASATFTLAIGPAASETTRGPDLDPVEISVAHGKWVLQDLMPGGLGSYVLPLNPQSWVSPVFERTLTARHTTAQTGKFHVSEGYEHAVEWSFTGFCPDQAMHDMLLAYGNLNRRFYVIDHHNRAWKTTFTNVELVARRRLVWQGQPTDWAHDYTVHAVAFEQIARVPV